MRKLTNCVENGCSSSDCRVSSEQAESWKTPASALRFSSYAMGGVVGTPTETVEIEDAHGFSAMAVLTRKSSGIWIAAATVGDGAIRVYDARGRSSAIVKPLTPLGRVTRIVELGDGIGVAILAGSSETHQRLYVARTDLLADKEVDRPQLLVLEGELASAAVSAVCALPRGRELAAALADSCEILVFNADTGAVRLRLGGHRAPVLCLTPLPGRRLASGGMDTSIRVWSTDPKQLGPTGNMCLSLFDLHPEGGEDEDMSRMSSSSSSSSSSASAAGGGHGHSESAGHSGPVTSLLALRCGAMVSMAREEGAPLLAWIPRGKESRSFVGAAFAQTGFSRVTGTTLVELADQRLALRVISDDSVAPDSALGHRVQLRELGDRRFARCLDPSASHADASDIVELAALPDGRLAGRSLRRRIFIWGSKALGERQKELPDFFWLRGPQALRLDDSEDAAAVESDSRDHHGPEAEASADGKAAPGAEAGAAARAGTAVAGSSGGSSSATAALRRASTTNADRFMRGTGVVSGGAAAGGLTEEEEAARARCCLAAAMGK